MFASLATNFVIRPVRTRFRAVADAWHQFWFDPVDPLIIGVIRFLTGWMLFYNLLVWTLDLDAFFSRNGLQPLEAVRRIHDDGGVFCFWLWIDDAWLWPVHWLCLAISAMFCLGILSRITSILAFLITISYSQRVPVANFGFDQILGMLCLYLALAPSGASFSLDSVWRRFRCSRKGIPFQISRSSSARMSMRLIQLHLCAIYFWAGISKLKGPSWWTGEALWRVIANQEYQTMDLTWLAWFPAVPFIIAHVTILWELFFVALIWRPSLRGIMLAMGVLMHVGIGAFLGMWTFGLIMAFAYLSFSDPSLWRRRMDRIVLALSFR
ncbi:MAG: HTTM domain-containing protein [Planctomycetaceae bacterium]